jgi:hypothetical protein
MISGAFSNGPSRSRSLRGQFGSLFSFCSPVHLRHVVDDYLKRFSFCAKALFKSSWANIYVSAFQEGEEISVRIRKEKNNVQRSKVGGPGGIRTLDLRLAVSFLRFLSAGLRENHCLGSLSVLILTRLRAQVLIANGWLKNCWALGSLGFAYGSFQSAGNVFTAHYLNVRSKSRSSRRT